MLIRTIVVCLALFSTFSYAQGRKPAVEDFVGIDVEEKRVAPHGTESLYNLEQDIQKIEAQKSVPVKVPEHAKEATSDWGPTTILISFLALGLPLMVWFLVMSHLRRKASADNASNIAVLEKYRKDREKKSEESIRKVS